MYLTVNLKNNLSPVSRHNCLSEADLLIVPSALSSEEVQALKKEFNCLRHD